MNKFFALLLTLLSLLMGTLVVAQSASAASCSRQVGNYQYAWPSPAYEQLTATTMSCRVNAPWVIVIHGGSWINGTRVNGDRETYYFLQVRLAGLQHRLPTRPGRVVAAAEERCAGCLCLGRLACPPVPP